MVVRTFHPGSVGRGKIVRTRAPVFDRASSFLTTVIDRRRPGSMDDMEVAASEERQKWAWGVGVGGRSGGGRGGVVIVDEH